MKNLVLFSVLLATGILAGHTLAQRTSAATSGPNSEISLADRQSIYDLIAAYSHTWDSKDQTRWAALFTEDAVFQTYRVGVLANDLATKKELMANAIKRHAKFSEDGIQTRHYQTNTLLTELTDGSVRGETTYFVTWQYAGEKTPRVMHTGIFRDSFVQTSDGWRFARREVHSDHT